LARKRANDREAQRNIRQRTKEHIETLERKVQELEQGRRSESMERVLKRNRELEAEIEKLRAQLAVQHAPSPVATGSEPADELLMPSQKVSLETLEWTREAGSSCPWPKAAAPQLKMRSESPSTSYPAPAADSIYTPTPSSSTTMGYEETAQTVYSTTSAPSGVWDEPAAVFGPPTTQALAKPLQAWAPFNPSFSQPSRFADLQQAGFNDLISNPQPYETSCWQNQPSIYAWQLSTKLKAPATYVDELMFST
jgi:hypothetical protein